MARHSHFKAMTRRLLKPLWVLIALLFLFEAWLWDLLQPLIAWIVARLPWRAFKAALARGITKLPAAVVVFVFVLPDVILFPVKLFALWILAKGAVVSGTVLFVFAKALGLVTALVLFEVCRDKLMELSWFRWTYDQVMRARAWAKTQAQPLVDQIAATRHRIALRIKALLGDGGFISMLRRLRATVKRRATRPKA